MARAPAVTPTLDSDWDIAVFLTDGPTPDDLDRLSDLGTDLLYDTGAVCAADADPVASPPGGQLPAQGNPLRGYSSLKEEARRHLRRAKRLLSSVEARVEAELPEIIAHTAYYAMYHAAMAVFVE